MLSSSNRLTSPTDFREVARRGHRCGGPLMVVHLVVQPSAHPGATSAARVGFVVSKAVGNAVVRNLVKRRLRHLARQWTATLPPGALLVVRALPASAGAAHAELADELDRCLGRCLAKQAEASPAAGEAAGLR